MFMKYLRDDERIDGFINNLSEASGVGHVIPNYQNVLNFGLKHLMDKAKSQKDACHDKVKQDFYQAAILFVAGRQ